MSEIILNFTNAVGVEQIRFVFVAFFTFLLFYVIIANIK